MGVIGQTPAILGPTVSSPQICALRIESVRPGFRSDAWELCRGTMLNVCPRVSDSPATGSH